MDKRKLGSFTVIYLLQITAEKMCCIPSYPKKRFHVTKKSNSALIGLPYNGCLSENSEGKLQQYSEGNVYSYL
jgi:hypothetical protein